ISSSAALLLRPGCEAGDWRPPDGELRAETLGPPSIGGERRSAVTNRSYLWLWARNREGRQAATVGAGSNLGTNSAIRPLSESPRLEAEAHGFVLRHRKNATASA